MLRIIVKSNNAKFLFTRTFFTIIWMSVAGSLKAEVKNSFEYIYYNVKADPSRSLLSILDSSTPIRKDGSVFHGHTYWNVKWNFRWSEKPDGSCRITSVTTNLSCEIKLPKLLDARGEQRNQFRKYLSALRTHELGHCKIGKSAAATIDRKILSLPEMPSCSDLGSAGNDIGYKTIAEHKKKGALYDAKTEHGKSQGAWLER